MVFVTSRSTLYANAFENDAQILFECSFSRAVWNLAGLNDLHCLSDVILVDNSRLKALILLIFKVLWRERNQRIFVGNNSVPAKIVNEAFSILISMM